MKTMMDLREIPSDGLDAVPDCGVLRLYFDFETVEPEGGPDGTESPRMLRCENVDVPMEESDYGGIVSAIVAGRYSSADVQAIIANYGMAKEGDDDVPADKREEYLAEYAEFQAWRKRAKEIAKMALEKIG